MTEKRALVIGPNGVVGPFVVDRLVRAGHRPLCLSRTRPKGARAGVDWLPIDLDQPESIPNDLPECGAIYCIAGIARLPAVLPKLLGTSANRLIAFSSTSAETKADSEIPSERQTAASLIEGERRTIDMCKAHNVDWTIFRPTLIYAEGRDANVTRLARLIARFGVFPIIGSGQGLRQPVHGDDLAAAALLAMATDAARNKTYNVTGGETIAYREMVGRIFDALGKRRHIVSIPEFVWRAGFALARPLLPNVTVTMGTRMSKDMAFDGASLQQDLNWQPRNFLPDFKSVDLN